MSYMKYDCAGGCGGNTGGGVNRRLRGMHGRLRIHPAPGSTNRAGIQCMPALYK